MSTLAVVEQIMRQTKTPMAVRDIVEIAGDVLPTRSKTPDTVVARDLSMDIKKHGDESRFIRTAPGRYTMREFVSNGWIQMGDSGNTPQPTTLHTANPQPLAPAVPATSAHPTAVQPTAVQPTAVQPAAVQPAAVQPAAVQPAAVQPTAVQPTAVQPTAVQPTAVQPTAVQPAAVQPAAVQPTAVQPAAVQPTPVLGQALAAERHGVLPAQAMGQSISSNSQEETASRAVSALQDDVNTL